MAWTNLKGFIFNDNPAGITPSTNEVAFIGDSGGNIAASSQYPQSKTIDGDTFNCGWVNVSLDGARTRNTGLDRRLAGIHLIGNNVAGGRVFRIDTPSANDYEIFLAAGDANAGKNCYWQILDTATPLDIVDNTATTLGAEDFYDATGALHLTAALWVANQVGKIYTFGTTVVNVRMGKGSGTGESAMAYIGIRQVAGAAGQPTARRPAQARPTEIGRTGGNVFRNFLKSAGGVLVPAWR